MCIKYHIVKEIIIKSAKLTRTSTKIYLNLVGNFKDPIWIGGTGYQVISVRISFW